MTSCVLLPPPALNLLMSVLLVLGFLSSIVQTDICHSCAPDGGHYFYVEVMLVKVAFPSVVVQF